MPMIRVEMFPGRSQAQKRALVERLTEAFVEAAGGTPQSVQVVITEIAPDHWGSGGRLISDRLAEQEG